MSRLRSIVAVAAATLVIPAFLPAQAAGSVPSAISLSAPASGEYGTSITLQGRLWRYGTSQAIGGALVWLQRTPHGQRAWANVTNGRTASNGNYAFVVTQTGAYDYRTVYSAFTRGVVYSNRGGSFEVPKPASNPQQDTITQNTTSNSNLQIGVNPSGCRQVSTSTRWEYGAGTFLLELESSTKVVAEGTLYQGSTLAMSGALDPADPRLYFGISNPQSNGGVGTTTKMLLLCVN